MKIVNKNTKWTTCPCCGYKTIQGEHDGCRICGWQHDLFQVRYPDDIGANGDLTLRQAQENFQRTGNSEGKPSTRKTATKEDRDPNWKPLPPLAKNS